MSEAVQAQAVRARRSLLHLLLADFARLSLVLLLLHLFVFNFSLVRGSSMQPNIHDGDRLLVDKLSYNVGAVERFDVVILSCPKDPRVDYVKRIVGLPNDVVHLHCGHLYVNDQEIEEPFTAVLDLSCDGRWVVPPDNFFVLGDNRPVSSDSREGWCVPRQAIKGKVRACLWPLERVRTF